MCKNYIFIESNTGKFLGEGSGDLDFYGFVDDVSVAVFDLWTNIYDEDAALKYVFDVVFIRPQTLSYLAVYEKPSDFNYSDQTPQDFMKENSSVAYVVDC